MSTSPRDCRPFGNRFDIFRHLEGFLEICRTNGLRKPDGYESYLPAVARMEKALVARPAGPVSCNNDLLAENLIEVGATCASSTSSSSGTDHRGFELGDLAAES